MRGRALSAADIPEGAVSRFWLSVAKAEGCWLWRGNCDTKGYGKFHVSGRAYRATRVAYALTKGPIAAGLLVCHACDNPPCCNPDHLWLGSDADNARDMVEKGRASRRAGVANTRCRLSPDQVRSIRHDSRSHRRIARAYGVGRTTVRNIQDGITWGSIS